MLGFRIVIDMHILIVTGKKGHKGRGKQFSNPEEIDRQMKAQRELVSLEMIILLHFFLSALVSVSYATVSPRLQQEANAGVEKESGSESEEESSSEDESEVNITAVILVDC